MAGPPKRDGLFACLGCALPGQLLDEALTHPSASSAARPDYERLEFLGDRVLNLVIAEALLARHPGEREGQLALRLNALVRRETVAAVAGEIGLGAHLHLGRSEAGAGGRKRDTILCDAMEAVIAAIYLEHGIDGARRAVARLWGPRLDDQPVAPQDAKTALQEWAQARGMPPPEYRTVDRSGPDHAPRFTIEARLASGASASATGSSKRVAEQAAAASLLQDLPDE